MNEAANGGGLGDDEARGREILADTDSYGEATLLRDGTISARNYDGSALTTDQVKALNRSLSDIASTKDGAAMLAQVSTENPLQIVLNNEGIGYGMWSPGARRLTMDLSPDRYFYNHANGKIVEFSATRVLAHEMRHAISGGIWNMPSHHSRLIQRTDSLMSGINGTIRNTSNNYLTRQQAELMGM